MINKLYKEKLTTSKLAVESIQDSSKICIAMASCQPPALVEELANAINDDVLLDSKIYYKLAMKPIGEYLANENIASKSEML